MGLNRTMKLTPFILVVLLAALVSSPARADISGPPTVIDGETLEVQGRRVRLYGIDAPDIRQTCEIGSRTYNCGRISRTALMDLVAGVDVRCRLRGQTKQGVALATCLAAGYDISAGMVHTGWAMAMPRQGTVYSRIEKEAEKARRGLWKGVFAPPWEWAPAK